MNLKIFSWILVSLVLVSLVVAQETTGCTTDWVCSSWTDCVNGQQSRSCNDLNFCGEDETKPEETRSCTGSETVSEPQTPVVTQPEPTETVPETVECVEQWLCEPWSDCIGGKQSRICEDLASCGTTLDKPKEVQDCDSVTIPVAQFETEDQLPPEESTSYLFYFGIILLIAGIVGIGYVIYIYLQNKGVNLPLPKQTKPETDPVFTYIQQMRTSGYTNEQIQSELTKSGYSQEEIVKYIPQQNSQLKQYTKQMMESGFNMEIIQDHLMHHGYDANYVKEHLLELLRLK